MIYNNYMYIYIYKCSVCKKSSLPTAEFRTGLVHITQIRDGFVESVEDELSVGQEVGQWGDWYIGILVYGKAIPK